MTDIETPSDGVGEVPSTTEDPFIEPHLCENCGKEFHPQDSITLRDNGSIKECMHWPIIRQEG